MRPPICFTRPTARFSYGRVVMEFFAHLKPEEYLRIISECLGVSIEVDPERPLHLHPLDECVSRTPHPDVEPRVDILYALWCLLQGSSLFGVRVEPPLQGSFEEFCATLPESTADTLAFLIAIWEQVHAEGMVWTERGKVKPNPIPKIRGSIYGLALPDGREFKLTDDEPFLPARYSLFKLCLPPSYPHKGSVLKQLAERYGERYGEEYRKWYEKVGLTHPGLLDDSWTMGRPNWLTVEEYDRVFTPLHHECVQN